MNRERESLKRQLDAELEEIRLSTERRNHVIGQIRPKGWRAQLKAMWNTEIEIPLSRRRCIRAASGSRCDSEGAAFTARYAKHRRAKRQAAH